MVEHLTPTDASMLAIEDADHGSHIQVIYVFEGEPPTPLEFRETVEQRLLGAPRFRQRVVRVPFNLGRPAWVDDERFDLDFHLRRTALPSPGGEEELRALSNRLLQRPLDLGRPLWEMWLVEGLAANHFAVIHRVHHCMVDGVATQDISGMMFSSSPEEDRPVAEPACPGHVPSQAELVVSGLSDLAAHSSRVLAGLLRGSRAPRDLWDDAVQSARTLGTLTGVSGAVPTTLINRPGGPRRRTDWVRLPMAELRETKNLVGTTLNNVVLAAATGALHRYLERQGEPITAGMRAMVPVSVRLDPDRGVLGNQVSAIYPVLPVGETDPERRLALVAAEVEELRGGQGVALERLMNLGGFAPPTIMEQVQRLLLLNPGAHNLVISNVPGPGTPYYLRGRKLVEVLPSGTTMPRHGLNLVMISYLGTLFVAVSSDPDVVPDAAGFASALEHSFAELRDWARTRVDPAEPAQ
ncbi:wax ester/triacylglycerol synthase family O-acyltransferase [Nocardioides caeni]|uniref:Diacylglycerol O-acyltransferase n=1 Tax=Nocardioides caeni TaxID=574700 RepID=A0A4S8NHA8_9ACTN|nr:wax ester/triacylglycerol synthase family O-acyltransferase [Nocardioides caeni]THV16008.1 wax ester/triacylglycerol synthase family O-acyltransferase [Nocardioides caeni]